MQGRSDPNAELLDAAALCRHLVPDDSVHAFLADHRRDLFPDEMFADLFPSGRGRPSVPADVVATVMVLQSLEGLSDRDAAAALRTNIAWKVATGLALDDAGIHYSVLTYWRARLRDSDQPERVLDAVRAGIDQTGGLGGRRARALDSAWLGGLFHACGQVDGIAESGVLHTQVRAACTDHHQSGIDAYAHV